MTRGICGTILVTTAAVVSLFATGQVRASVFSESATPFTANGTFKTQTNQSQFSATQAITLDSDEFYGVTFDTGEKTFGGIEEGLFGDFYGAEGSFDFSGKVGLQTQFSLNSGSVDVNLPYTVSLGRTSTLTGTIDNGMVTTTLSPSFQVNSTGASFRSTFPDVNFSSDLTVKLDASAKASVCVVDCFVDNAQLVPEDLRSIDVQAPLFSFDGTEGDIKIGGVSVLKAAQLPGVLDPIPLEPGVFLVPTLDVGTTNTLGLSVQAGAVSKKTGKPVGISAGTSVADIQWTPIADSLDASLTGSSARNLLGGGTKTSSVDVFAPSVDVDGILGLYSPLPPGGITANIKGVQLNADLFDGDIGPTFGIKQVFEFDPKAQLTLDFDRPVKVSTNGGASYALKNEVVLTDLAADQLVVQVDHEVGVQPFFALSPELRNDLDLTLKPSLSVTGLSASASALGEEIFSVPPLLKLKPELPEAKLADLYDERFGLKDAGSDSILKLPRFTIAAGLTQSGTSPDNPRDHTSINADASVTKYKIDYNDATGSITAGNSEVEALLFRSNVAPVRTKTIDTCTPVSFPDHCWSNSTTYPTQPANTTGRFLDLSDVVRNDEDPSRATQIAVASGSGSAAVPSQFIDETSYETSFITKNGTHVILPFGGTTPISLPGTRQERTLFSDAYQKETVSRGQGLGLDQPLWLEFDLLSDAGDDGRVEFAREVEFDLGIDKTLGQLSSTDRDFVTDRNGELTGLLFESFHIDGGPGSELRKLLLALGDTDGLNLVVNFDPDRFGFNQTNNGGDGTNSIEIKFNPLVEDLDFNFFDDFFSRPGDYLSDPDAYDLISSGQMTLQGMNAIDGVKQIKITDFDFSASVFNGADGNFAETLFQRLGDFDAATALTIGVTFDDMVNYDYDATTGKVTENRLDPGDARFATVITARVRDTGQLSRTFTQKPPPTPPDVGPTSVALGDVNSPGVNSDACSAADCNGLSITVSETDINTGTVTTSTQSAESFLGANQKSLTVLPDDTSAPGTSAGRGLTAGAVTPGGQYVFDLDEQVALWGDELAYRDVVFFSSSTLKSGEPCGASLPGLVDQQVVGRVAPGGVPDLGGIDRNGYSPFQVSSCFVAQDTSLVFGQEAPVYVDLPLAPSLAFEVSEGPMFTSVSLPGSGGDNALLKNPLGIFVGDAMGDLVRIGTLGLGDSFSFDTPVLKFVLATLAVDESLLGDDPGLEDTALTAVFGLTVDTAGTVITVTPTSGVPEPASALLLMAGGVLLLGGRRRRER